MNVPEALVRLYPPEIRRRWGTEIAHEARLAGPRTWFDTALGAVKSWLRPGDWPEPVPGQTSRLVLSALAAVLTASVLLVRAFGPIQPGAQTNPIVTGIWLAPIAAGTILSVPLPCAGWSALRKMIVVSARTGASPALAVTVLVWLAHSGFADDTHGAVHGLLVGYYWATIVFVGHRLCLLVRRLSRITVAPGLRRLRGALLCCGTGLAVAAVEAGLGSTGHPEMFAVSAVLAALAAALVGAGQDLGA